MKTVNIPVIALVLALAAGTATAAEGDSPDVRKAFLEALNALEFGRFDGFVSDVPVREALKFVASSAGVELPLPDEAEKRMAKDEAESAAILALMDRLRFAREKFDWKGVHLSEILKDIGRRHGFQPEFDAEALESPGGGVPPREYADLVARLGAPVRLSLKKALLDEAVKALSSQGGVTLKVGDDVHYDSRIARRSILTGRMRLDAALDAVCAQYGVRLRYEKGSLVFCREAEEPLPWDPSAGNAGFWVSFSGEAPVEDALRAALASCMPPLALRFRAGRWTVAVSNGATFPWDGELPGYIRREEISGGILGAVNSMLQGYGLAVGFPAGKPALVQADKAEASVPRTGIAYHLSFLKGTSENFPGHFPETGDDQAASLWEKESGERWSAMDMREKVLYYVRDNLLCRGSMGPDLNEAELSGNVLTVKATPDVHEKIAGLLNGLGMNCRKAVKITFHFLQADLSLMKELSSSGGLSWGGLEPVQVAMIEKAIADKTASSLKRSSIIAFNGQKVNASSVRQRTYVRDYDVEVAQGAQIGDPIVGMIREGMVCEAVPVVFGGGRILVDLRTAVAKVVEPVESFETPHGAISMPKIDFQRIATSLFVNDGGSVLLGGTGSIEVGKNLLLLLTVSVIPDIPDEKLKATSWHRRAIRVFDIRDLTHAVPDRPGPEVGITINTDGGSSVPVFSEDYVQAGEIFEADQLVDLIRGRVDPQSWEDEKNSINLVLGSIVAVNRKEVLDEAAVLLEECRGRRMKGVEIVTRFLSLPGKDLAAIIGSDPKRGSQQEIGEKLVREILAFAEKDPKAVLSVSTFSQLHKQRASMQIGRNVPYVRDVDVEVAQQTTTSDPVTGQLLEGVFLDFQVEIDPDSDDVTLNLRPTMARLRKMSLCRIGGDAGRDKEESGGEKGGQEHGGSSRIMLPELDLQKIRTTVTLRTNSSAMVVVPAEAGEETDRDLVMLVTVRITGAAGK